MEGASTKLKVKPSIVSPVFAIKFVCVKIPGEPVTTISARNNRSPLLFIEIFLNSNGFSPPIGVCNLTNN